MQTSETIFSMFYAVLFGLMLSHLASFKAFPWGFMSEGGIKRQMQLIARLTFSLAMFNVIPFLLFAVGFDLISKLQHPLTYTDIVLSGVLALSVFAPYRMHHLITSVCHNVFYEDKEWEDIVSGRAYRKTPLGHALAVGLYLSPLAYMYICR